MGEGSGLLDTKVPEREMTPYWPQQHKTGQFCRSTEVSCVKHLTVITIKCNKAMSREKVTLHHNMFSEGYLLYSQYSPHILCSGVDGTTCVQTLSVTFDCDVTATTHHKRPRLTDHSLAVLHWEGSSFSSVDITGTRRKGSTNI